MKEEISGSEGVERMGLLWKAYDRTKVLLQLTRINLRVSVLTLVGLILAMASISSCLIYLESNRSDFYANFFENELDKDYLEYKQSFESIVDLTNLDISNSHTLLKNNIVNQGLEQVLVENPFGPVSMYNDGLFFLNQTRHDSFIGLTSANSLLNEMIEGSSLPTEQNEVILMTENPQEITTGEELNISIPYTLSPIGGQAEYLNRTVKITGIITPISLHENSSLLKFRDIQRYYQYGHYLLLTPLDNYFSFFQELNTTLNQLINHTHQFPSDISFSFTVNKEHITSQNVLKIVPKLLKYTEVTRWGFSLNNTEFNARVVLYNHLINKESQFGMFFVSFLLFSIPTFLLTILLVNYSVGMINERRQKSLILFKSRGVSDKFILLALLFEIFVLVCLVNYLIL